MPGGFPVEYPHLISDHDVDGGRLLILHSDGARSIACFEGTSGAWVLAADVYIKVASIGEFDPEAPRAQRRPAIDLALPKGTEEQIRSCAIVEAKSGRISQVDFLVYAYDESGIELVQRFATPGGGRLVHLDDDEIPELRVYDSTIGPVGPWSMADWPAPNVVYAWTEEGFQFDLVWTESLAPRGAEFERRKQLAQASFKNERVDAPARFAAFVLDVMYQIDEQSGWRLIDELWPTEHPGKHRFEEDLRGALAKSEIYALVRKARE